MGNKTLAKYNIENAMTKTEGMPEDMFPNGEIKQLLDAMNEALKSI